MADENDKEGNDVIISLVECKRILNRNGNSYTDEEILKIREFLIALAKIQYDDYKRKRK